MRKQKQPTSTPKSSKSTKADVLANAFGLWRGVNIDGLEYQQKLRAEWVDEEGLVRRRNHPSRKGKK